MKNKKIIPQVDYLESLNNCITDCDLTLSLLFEDLERIEKEIKLHSKKKEELFNDLKKENLNNIFKKA